MNKTPRLSKSGIEYLDYMWGIWSGCNNWKSDRCSVGQKCWALGLANRFHNIYPNGFEPTFYPEALNSPKHLKKPSLIGVGWVGDVIGYCDKVSERSLIYQTILQCPQHTFLFLTKNPERLPKWSPFPNNCWVGVTATNEEMYQQTLFHLDGIKSSIKFISFEPLLERIALNVDDLGMIDWLIIGAQTKPYKPPKIEWVQEIETAAVQAGIPIFEKNNLQPLLQRDLIQELPRD